MASPDHKLVLTAIHASFLAGILSFFALTVYLAPDPGDAPAWTRWSWLVVTAAAVFGVGYARGRLPRAAPPERVRGIAIAMWALAEGSALFGIVCMWMSGSIAPALGASLVSVVLLMLHRPSTLS